MLSPELRAQLERHWEYAGKDEDIAHEMYADHAVLEFPQGGERYEGVENLRGWRRQYPEASTDCTNLAVLTPPTGRDGP